MENSMTRDVGESAVDQLTEIIRNKRFMIWLQSDLYTLLHRKIYPNEIPVLRGILSAAGYRSLGFTSAGECWERKDDYEIGKDAECGRCCRYSDYIQGL